MPKTKLTLVMLMTLFLSLGMLATASLAKDGQPRIIAIGDSLMAWHRGANLSIADAVSKGLSEPVVNRSVSGARIIYGLPISGALGMKIANQFRQDRVDWVIMTGGGNDFMMGCGCGACERRMERLISPNGTRGEVPKLISSIRKTGARVVYVGYLRSPGVGSPIENCKDEGDAFEARLSKLAKRDKGLYFLSIRDLVPSGDRSFHSADMIHPSRKASRAIGARITKLIQKVDRTR